VRSELVETGNVDDTELDGEGRDASRTTRAVEARMANFRSQISVSH
jgi:hypothetical protein